MEFGPKMEMPPEPERPRPRPKTRVETYPEGEPKVFEKEPIMTITIDMARHSIKGKETADKRVPLSEEGVLAAIAAGLKGGQAEKVKAKARKGETVEVFGSPLERTSQSSVFRMLGEQFSKAKFKDVDPEDVVRWLEQGQAIKKVESPMMNFQLGSGEYGKEMMGNFKSGNLLKWTVERSDEAAKEFKQKAEEVTPLSIQAGNVAAFIWALGSYKAEQLLKQKGAEKNDFAFATSHQSVLESLLYKVIKMQEGQEAADQLVTDLENKGFAENEGFKVDYNVYDQEGKVWDVSITYNNKTYKLNPKGLFKIIQEGADLKKKLEENSIE